MKELLMLGKIMPRMPLVAALEGKVVLGAKGSVWSMTPEQAEELAKSLMEMAELARAMGSAELGLGDPRGGGPRGSEEPPGGQKEPPGGLEGMWWTDGA